MPSIKYINQSAPFWDFVASLENQSTQSNMGPQPSRGDRTEAQSQQQAWGWRPRGHGPRGGHPHHHGPHGPDGPHGPHGPDGHRGPPGPPPPHHLDGEDSPPFFEKGEGSSSGDQGEPSNEDARDPFEGRGPWGRAGRRGHCGRRGGPHKFGQGPWASARGFPFGGPFGGFGAFFGENETRENVEENFKPEADVFDTEDAYIVHVSLPGAKKDDVGVSWDAEKSELIVGGVVYRPGDEQLLQALALDERKVGAFERKVRLGSRANPAQVDVDHITAKLEDGILRIEVPKLDKDYVEIKKVDIEQS